MAVGRRIGRAALALLVVLGVLLWGIALILFSQVAENSDDFANYAVVYVTINAIGVAILTLLIVHRLINLVRDYRRFVPGSRLEARVVSLIGIVAVIPLVVLYMFSVAFIMRGIDEWLDVDIGEGLDEALALSEAAIDMRQEDFSNELALIAESLGNADVDDFPILLQELGESINAIGLAVYAENGEELATWANSPDGEAPPELNADELGQVPAISRQVGIDGRYFDEIYGRVYVESADGRTRILAGRLGVPQEMYSLGAAIELRHGEFAFLGELRAELKLAFAITLSLVLLIAALASVYAAFFVARRLLLPIQQLMQGTRAVARGDYETRVPLAQGDEIGFLVNSFNNMTRRIALAREEASSSEKRLEEERSKLEVILARLSTGVVSLEPDLTIRTANKSAGDILGVELESHVGESLFDLAEGRPLLADFLAAIAMHLEHGNTEWREQISLHRERGSLELVCACSELPREDDQDAGYILVFDDITALIQAQKEAAWGEVARRLAHEIKNPLTPIQLSAERVRRRYLAGTSGDLDLLDRATHTIIQQVDAMKGMVDAFSEYARAPDLELSELDLNALIEDVMELYRHQASPVTISLDLDESLPLLEADVGRLRQVIHNLMRNAIEAVEGQPGAEIEIRTRRVEHANGPYAEISVGDNGPGFSSEIIDQAFLPYVTSKTRGTGLGLAIVRKLVEEHGGQIRASNKPRRGAEVSILLPLPGAGHGARGRAHKGRKRA